MSRAVAAGNTRYQRQHWGHNRKNYYLQRANSRGDKATVNRSSRTNFQYPLSVRIFVHVLPS